jgi:hypothetical protein
MKVVSPITTLLHVLIVVQHMVVQRVQTFSTLSPLRKCPNTRLVSSKTTSSSKATVTTTQPPAILQATWSNGQAGTFHTL